MTRINKRFIKEMIKEGEDSFTAGRGSLDEQSCRKEFDGIQKIEYANNALEPEYKATDDEKKSSRILWRSKERKSFFNACVAKGGGRRVGVIYRERQPVVAPVPEPVSEPEPGSADERVRRGLLQLEGVDADEVEARQSHFVRELLSKDARRSDCRETLAYFLDFSAMSGKLYGLGAEIETPENLDKVGLEIKRELDRELQKRKKTAKDFRRIRDLEKRKKLLEKLKKHKKVIGRSQRLEEKHETQKAVKDLRNRKEAILKRCLREYPLSTEVGPTATDIMYKQVEFDGAGNTSKKKKKARR